MTGGDFNLKVTTPQSVSEWAGFCFEILPVSLLSFQVGFLKISHKYEITFLLPVSQNLRQQSQSVPLANLYLKLVDIAPVAEGYQVKCEYIAHKEGVVREEMVLASKINDRSPVKVTLQARVLDRLHGTPMLLEGVKCIGSEPEYDSEQSDWQGFD
ncbi:UPF0687 protein C20orf27 homolog [Chiloscyllium plagiosum]|uniref:UPF0687 protein C20orf27 homolog n=1 Tax=Chiloscyllium plagiosum TaxID=36176 RepID=UPI001CB84334|nr:UPF0687 protein C20orf27 homolog [Chiloscyllium plagiosum]